MKKFIVAITTTIVLTACTSTPSNQATSTSNVATTTQTTTGSTTVPVAPIKIDLPDLKGKTVKQGFEIAKGSGYQSWRIKFENQTLVEDATAIQDWIIEKYRVVDNEVFFSPTDPDSYSRSLIPPSVLTYKVYGAKSGDITYSWVNGSSQDANAKLPWSKETTEDIDFMYVSAQNKGGGEITCEILRDGNSIAKNTAKGSYAIATCSIS